MGARKEDPEGGRELQLPACVRRRCDWLAEPEMGRLVLETFLLNRKSIECVIRGAQYHESIIAQSGRLPIDPARLLQIRLTEAQ